MNSFVFWDDNPIEREKIKVNLKDVEVFEPDADISIGQLNFWSIAVLQNLILQKLIEKKRAIIKKDLNLLKIRINIATKKTI